MRISGNKTISISRQSSMVANADVFLDSLESSFSMILSGSSACGLRLSGSRFYNLDNEFVFAPDTDYNFDLSMYVDESGCLCSINNIPIDYKSGDFSQIDYIVLNGNAEVELGILGKTPSFDVSKISDLTISEPLTLNIDNLTPEREFLFYDAYVNETNISNLQIINKPTSGDSNNNFDLQFNCDSGILMESGFVDFSIKGNFGIKNFRQDFFCNTYDIEYIFDTNYSGGSVFNVSSGNFIDIYADFLSVQGSDFEVVLRNDGSTDITENWRLYSGDAGGVLTNLYDTNQYESGFFSGSIPVKPSFIYSLISRVEYLGGLPSGSVELNLRLGSENIEMTFNADD